MLSIDRALVTVILAPSVASCGPELSEVTRTPEVPAAAGAVSASAVPPSDPQAGGEGDAPPSGDCSATRSPDPPMDPDAIETIQPEQRVPAFDVTALDCRNLRSGDMVGRRPFVLVFFSSWCQVCERKMPMVRAAAASMGGRVDFIGVALDEDETWHNVSEFVGRHRLSFPIVRGAHFRNFSRGYDPFGSIPVVVVVGRDGVIVDLQVGFSPFDYNRLVGAAALAERPSPRARPNEVVAP